MNIFGLLTLSCTGSLVTSYEFCHFCGIFLIRFQITPCFRSVNSSTIISNILMISVLRSLMFYCIPLSMEIEEILPIIHDLSPEKHNTSWWDICTLKQWGPWQILLIRNYKLMYFASLKNTLSYALSRLIIHIMSDWGMGLSTKPLLRSVSTLTSNAVNCDTPQYLQNTTAGLLKLCVHSFLH